MKRILSFITLLTLLFAVFALEGCKREYKPIFPDVYEIEYTHYNKSGGTEDGKIMIGCDKGGSKIITGIHGYCLAKYDSGKYDIYDWDYDNEKWFLAENDKNHDSGASQFATTCGAFEMYYMTEKIGHTHADKVEKLEKTGKIAERECDFYKLTFNSENKDSGTKFDTVYEIAVDKETKIALQRIVLSYEIDGEMQYENRTEFVCTKFLVDHNTFYSYLIEQ